MMKKTMLSAIDKPRLYYKKAKMAKMKKAKMAKMKKAEMAMAKPKFNAKLKAAAAQGKIKNEKFKEAVMKAKLSNKKKAAKKIDDRRAKAAKKPGKTSPEEVARIKAQRIRQGLDPVTGEPKNPKKGPGRLDKVGAKRKSKAEMAQAKAKQRLKQFKKRIAKDSLKKPKASQTAGAIMRRERKMN